MVVAGSGGIAIPDPTTLILAIGRLESVSGAGFYSNDTRLF
ncbi:hypothetical protein F0726_00911 [Acidithiobacillus caldus]|nr:hypothetical protein F0726_00911 [Acidithiobacillus caldus]